MTLPDVDEETRAITARKLTFKATSKDAAKVKATLTPVGTERRGPAAAADPFYARMPEVPGVFLTHEAMLDVAKDLRRQAALLLDVADGLDTITGTQQVTGPAPAEAQAAREKAADESFGDRYSRLSKEAQAAAFNGNLVPAAREVFADMLTDNDAPIEAGSASASADWTCPTHGNASIRVLTSRRTQRMYRACEACSQFEKEVKAS